MKSDYSFLKQIERGKFFNKKKYDGVVPFTYDEVKDKLPQPIFESNTNYVDCYNFALKTLYKNTHSPKKDTGYVSNFVDAAFNQDIFLWDTVFMTFFCNLLHPYIPGICSLDNFYCKQLDDGEITREYVRDTGEEMPLWVNSYNKPLYSYFHNDYGYRKLFTLTNLPYDHFYKPSLNRKVEKNPYFTLDALNHPILAWAEWQSYLQTKDEARLELVINPLIEYYNAIKYHLQHENGLYLTDWASMDNSTRNKDLYLGVDISCEMVLFANNLCSIIEVLQKSNKSTPKYDELYAKYKADAKALKVIINDKMWNESDGFYYDLDQNCKHIKIKTAAAFWTLISGVANEAQIEKLVFQLNNKDTFNRVNAVPSLAGNEEGFVPEGGYWRGGIWAPMNAMVVSGLKACGQTDLASRIAKSYVNLIAEVFLQTGSIWEVYPADFVSSGDSDHKDFVGWTGIGAIMFMIEDILGITYKNNNVVFKIDEKAIERGKIGCANYWFADKTADFCAQKAQKGIEIIVNTKDTFTLEVVYFGKTHKFDISGSTKLSVDI